MKSKASRTFFWGYNRPPLFYDLYHANQTELMILDLDHISMCIIVKWKPKNRWTDNFKAHLLKATIAFVIPIMDQIVIQLLASSRPRFCIYQHIRPTFSSFQISGPNLSYPFCQGPQKGQWSNRRLTIEKVFFSVASPLGDKLWYPHN